MCSNVVKTVVCLSLPYIYPSLFICVLAKGNILGTELLQHCHLLQQYQLPHVVQFPISLCVLLPSSTKHIPVLLLRLILRYVLMWNLYKMARSTSCVAVTWTLIFKLNRYDLFLTWTTVWLCWRLFNHATHSSISKILHVQDKNVWLDTCDTDISELLQQLDKWPVLLLL